MLRRVENVTVSFTPSFFTGKGRVVIRVGRNTYTRQAKIHKTDWAREYAQQATYPVLLLAVGERRLWKFQGRCYWDNDYLGADQVYALLMTRQQREQQRIENAQATVAMGVAPRSSSREAIPDDVKQLVWVRDGGQCCHCGSGVELQYDHIIPRTKGGGNMAENIQILCGPCNRRKSAGLTVRRGSQPPATTVRYGQPNPGVYRQLVERTLWELTSVDSSESAHMFVTRISAQVRDISRKNSEFTSGEFIIAFKDAVVSSFRGETEKGRREIEEANADAAAGSKELQTRLDRARAANDLLAENAIWRERDARQAACQAKIDAVTRRAQIMQLRLATVTDLASVLGIDLR